MKREPFISCTFDFEPLCSAIFKSEECRYAGEETSCDRTANTCKKYDNFINFRGFPTMPIPKDMIMPDGSVILNSDEIEKISSKKIKKPVLGKRRIKIE